MELLLGCGNNREKKIKFPEIEPTWVNLVTLDWEDSCNPDVLHDLNILPYPFDDNLFDEIHAYEVLEHCGRQGDYRFFFQQFEEFHRILKPGGWFIGTCPMWDSRWAWADPGHTRVIAPETFLFLQQSTYDGCGKEGNPVTDYRFCYTKDFELYSMQEQDDQWGFVLRAKK